MEFCEIAMKMQDKFNVDIKEAIKILVSYIEVNKVSDLIDKIEVSNSIDELMI